MNFPFFVARRLFTETGDGHKVSRPAIRIATVGVALGLAVMIVSVSVAQGFKSEIKNKVTGFASDIQVMNSRSFQSTESYPIEVNDSLLKMLSHTKGVRHAQPYSYKAGMLKTETDFSGMMLKGVGKDYDNLFLQQHLKAGIVPAFSDSISQNAVVISQMMANKLKLKVGDKVFAYFFDGNIRARRFTVKGIFETNMTEFDENMVFTDRNTVTKLNGWDSCQASGVELAVSDYAQLDSTLWRLIGKVNKSIDHYEQRYMAVSVEEMYPSIFSWLNLLDVNTVVILVLMIAVASFTMVSGLLIIILERTNFIGVMKALGATNASIRHIFLYFSVFIIGRGLLWGNVMGLLLIFSQMKWKWATLDASAYYLDAVPMNFDVWMWAVINAVTLLVSVLVLIVPSYLVSNIHPSRSIRFE